jgi:hypothetical protein
MYDAQEETMPTTYTHDLFGKNVYKKLPQEMKHVIRAHGDLYRIGLHGPDIFFYQLFSPRVNRTGVKMHREKAKAFFEQGMAQVRERGDQELLAYLLGFGCHYLLDSTCHPFVYRMVKERVVNHTLLEKEFDRMLLLETGYDPLTAHPADCIVPKKEYAKVIHRAVPLLSEGDVYRSLCMQKFLLNRMVHGKRGTTRAIVCGILAGTPSEELRELGEHFMRRDKVPHCRGPLKELHRLYDQALEQSPAELEELYACAFTEKELSDRWNHTYNG